MLICSHKAPVKVGVHSFRVCDISFMHIQTALHAGTIWLFREVSSGSPALTLATPAHYRTSFFVIVAFTRFINFTIQSIMEPGKPTNLNRKIVQYSATD